MISEQDKLQTGLFGGVESLPLEEATKAHSEQRTFMVQMNVQSPLQTEIYIPKPNCPEDYQYPKQPQVLNTCVQFDQGQEKQSQQILAVPANPNFKKLSAETHVPKTIKEIYDIVLQGRTPVRIASLAFAYQLELKGEQLKKNQALVEYCIQNIPIELHGSLITKYNHATGAVHNYAEPIVQSYIRELVTKAVEKLYQPKTEGSKQYTLDSLTTFTTNILTKENIGLSNPLKMIGGELSVQLIDAENSKRVAQWIPLKDIESQILGGTIQDAQLIASIGITKHELRNAGQLPIPIYEPFRLKADAAVIFCLPEFFPINERSVVLQRRRH